MQIYTEENGRFSIDCSTANWSTDELNAISHKYTNSLLCDVDFVIEDDSFVYLVEYKNSEVKNAPDAKKFDPLGEDKLNNVARKFYDSIHILNLMGRVKPRKYVYVVEFANGNSTSRKGIRNRLKKRLPFQLQEYIGDHSMQMIYSIDVVNIEEWNANKIYGRFPIKPVANT